MKRIWIGDKQVQASRQVFTDNVAQYATREDESYIAGMVATEYGLVRVFCEETYNFGAFGRYVGLALYTNDGMMYTHEQNDKGRVTVEAAIRRARWFARLIGQEVMEP